MSDAFGEPPKATRQRRVVVCLAVLDLSGWKFLTESMTATVVEDQVGNRKDQRERARDKLSTVGTRTGSEAGNSGRVGDHTRSPTVIKLNPVEPDGARGKNQH